MATTLLTRPATEVFATGPLPVSDRAPTAPTASPRVPTTRPVRARRPSSRRLTPRSGVRGGLRPRPLRSQPTVGAGQLRLTRRGRLVLLVALVAVLSATFALGRSAAQGSTVSVQPPAAAQLTVQPGDTLWSVASRLAPGQDPRPVVEQIRRLNRLDRDTLRAGEMLLLPQKR